ncbi:V-type proton ATPase subunit D [Eurytemora carolleeae]|uniref:V-type proton ATPase subunit D n=1 Tax=Eurytemora carolleeae TaxID=1294199 RepID=UPI000C77635F|nr:V-type proton ATPase subunit D [Eurytemora carolleeae]|eukprot:XP_023344360.1 V-type proton ATPase subunit D-like [Eurytemora affinis]
MSSDKINVFPSRGAQTTMKGRLKGAQKGHSLLKKKADALQMKFRSILKKIIDTKQTMGEIMKEASFSLAEAKFASGDFNHAVLQNVNKAQIKIKTRNDNVAGVNLPVFEAYQVFVMIKGYSRDTFLPLLIIHYCIIQSKILIPVTNLDAITILKV